MPLATSYQTLVNAFFTMVEKDIDFFHYFQLTDLEAMALAKERAVQYMKEAVWELTSRCSPAIDFTLQDDVLEEFAEDFTGKEILLLSALMYERYLKRDIAKLKCLSVNFTSTDLRVFDPSNARSTFQKMYEGVVAENRKLLDEYVSRDRVSGKLVGIDYASFGDVE